MLYCCLRKWGGSMAERRDCGMLLKQINDTLQKNANNSLKSQDLTMVQIGVLLFLDKSGQAECSLKEVEQHLHVAQSTAAGIVSRLEQKGFVEGFGSAEDKRIKMIRITEQGCACCRAAEQEMDHTEQLLLSGLTETERGIFQSLLQKVYDTMK